MPTKGYKRYRGRVTRRRRLMFLLLTLLAIAVLVVVLSFFIYPQFIVMTPEGPVFDPPAWLAFMFPKSTEQSPSPGASKSPRPSASPSASPSAPLVIESPSPSVSPSDEPALELFSRMVFIPGSAFDNNPVINAAINRVKSGDIDGLVLEMKAINGSLNYNTAIEGTKDAGAVSKYADSAQSLIDRLKSENIPFSAYVSCFKDNIMPRKVQSTSLLTNGVPWLDYNMHGWMNPYSDNALLYIENVLTELSDMGFNEIVLDYFSFPVQGKLSLIDYGSLDENGGGRPSALGAFAEDLASKIKTPVSAIINAPALLSGSELASGQELYYMSSSFKRLFIYVEQNATEDSLKNISDAAESASGDLTLIPVVEADSITAAAGIGESFLNEQGAFLIKNGSGDYKQ